MTYNVFGGTLNLAQLIMLLSQGRGTFCTVFCKLDFSVYSCMLKSPNSLISVFF